MTSDSPTISTFTYTAIEVRLLDYGCGIWGSVAGWNKELFIQHFHNGSRCHVLFLLNYYTDSSQGVKRPERKAGHLFSSRTTIMKVWKYISTSHTYLMTCAERTSHLL